MLWETLKRHYPVKSQFVLSGKIKFPVYIHKRIYSRLTNNLLFTEKFYEISIRCISCYFIKNSMVIIPRIILSDS